MIEAQIHQNDKLIMERTYYEPNLSLEMVLMQLKMYCVKEQLNLQGECLLRVRFTNLSIPKHKASVDTSAYPNISLPKKDANNE